MCAMTAPPVELSSLLVSRPGYRQGRPCLRGTGITVHNVAARHLSGVPIDEMIASNPDLAPSLFYAAIAYYLANKEQIERELGEDDAEGARLAALYPAALPPR